MSSSVALSTFALAQRELVNDLEESAHAQAFSNARRLRSNLQRAIDSTAAAAAEADDGEEPTTDSVRELLELTLRANQAQVLLVPEDGQDRSLSGLESRNIPSELRALVAAGEPASMRYVTPEGTLRYAVGLRFADLDVDYYEVVPVDDLVDTLASLRVILVGVSAATILTGGLIGFWSARRALQPLGQVSRAAEAIASGDIDTHLDSSGDPDLEPLTHSFNSMVDTLRERIERDERFASDVSHELRSPLMTLAASVEVLERREDELSDTARKAVELLGKDVRRFQRLVEDLLEISRMDLGAVSLDLSPIVLGDFLRFVVEQSRTPEVPVQYHERFADLVVVADKRRLAQAITNLIDNASKYAGDATAVRFQRMGQQVHIVVEDGGPGVAPQDRERIFDRFTRAGADAGRRDVAKGVGLGLSLVTEHVRLHGGQVWVTDRLDGHDGARFVIELPIGDPERVDEMAEVAV